MSGTSSITMPGLKENYERLKSDAANVKRTIAFAAALPKFFRERVAPSEAKEQIKILFDTRAERFCEMVRALIYDRPDSPYRKLLHHAGCQFSDLQSHVQRHGLEETLAKLAGEGVYLTSDEFKGKIDVVRGGSSFRVSPKDFERPDLSTGFPIESSGTRNAPTPTFSPLEWRALQTLGTAVFYEAHDLFSSVHAVYEPVIAGRMLYILINGKLGIPTDRWFALNVAVHGAVEDRYHYLNARLVAKMGNWFGSGIATPEYLDPGDVQPILAWVSEKRRERRQCCLVTVVSNAARIARAARAAGVSLDGLTFHASGEPLTQFKREFVEKTGARIALHYGPGGGNGTSLGCGNYRFIDEVHVPQTMFTFVEHPRPLDCGGPSIHPLMLTTLHASAPRFLLNVQNGDYATMVRRDCGCPLEKVGFTQHLHTIRSFEKFTSEGVNYFSTDVFALIENTIPSEFGGGPGDYQLVEEEDNVGQTRLTLLVHPGVGEVDEEKLLSRLHQALAQGSRNNRFMTGIWRNAGTFRIRRQPPYASARGKILPLQIRR
jgi:hypothetical protein